MVKKASSCLLPLFLTAVGCVYLSTLCPSVYLGDSGELTAAAFSLGVGHPSGYPLYALLGKVFCLIPIGNVGFRMNLMSAVFGVLAVWMVYSLIERITRSKVGAWTGAGVLAFIPLFWWQTVAAEVYTLHVFFVALLFWLLWRWDEGREFYLLMVFALVTGLSFGNHMQTVMLAPAVYYLILSREARTLVEWKRFLVLSLIFVVGLLVYVYLPVRTWANAAIHWGDPDNWDRFWAHVSGRAHRHGYVFNLGFPDYVTRAKGSLWLVWGQFGVLALVGLWGWWKIGLWRWRVFFAVVVVFDFVYTIGLNTVSLEITPFNLSTCVVMAVMVGVGVGEGVKVCERHAAGVVKVVKGACIVIPVTFMVLNYRVSDQSRNYTAYEHALNIFRTTEQGGTLFVDGDNNFIPLVYGRMVERMGESVTLYDRLNLVFKWPERSDDLRDSWEHSRTTMERDAILRTGASQVFYAVFDPASVVMPSSHRLIPCGILRKVVREKDLSKPYRMTNLWPYYAEESFYGDFYRDFMNRQIQGHFRLAYAHHLFASGNAKAGQRAVAEASEIAFDDYGLHLAASAILIDENLLDASRSELEKASLYRGDEASINNNWGCYYFKRGDTEKAVESFRKAIEIGGPRPVFEKNLKLALDRADRKTEAAETGQGMKKILP